MKIAFCVICGVVLIGCLSIWLVSQEIGAFIEDVKGDDSYADRE